MGGLARLGLNQRLALAALLLGALASLANVRPGRALKLHETDLASVLQRQEDSVAPDELASFVIAGRADYRLLDLRGAKDYERYHIPTAESVPLPALGELALLRNERVVLYGEDPVRAAQAWMLLRAKGYRNVYTLRGGLSAWQDEVLFPAPKPDPTPQEQARFERAAQVARSFGGQPRGAAADASRVAAPPLPVLAAPSPPAAAGVSSPRRKKEGC